MTWSTMTNSKHEETSDNPYPTIPSAMRLGSKRVNESPFSLFEQSTKRVQLSPIYNQEYAMSTTGKEERITVSSPQDYQVTFTQSLIDPNNIFPVVLVAPEHSPPSIFPQNIAAPSLSTSLPPPGGRFESTSQLAYFNSLLRKSLSTASTAGSVYEHLGPSQQGSTVLNDEDEQSRVRLLTTRIVEEFLSSNVTSSTTIAEVVVLGSSLSQGHYRRVLSSLVAKFENATLLDDDMLQGIIQLVRCAEPGSILSSDFLRTLAAIRTRLQDTHQHSTRHTYYLTLALSTLIDALVECKVQDPGRVVDQDYLLAILEGLSKSSDPYLKHQATYALQGLLHVPNDESRRQFVLRHTGNIAMGLPGVSSVCKPGICGRSGDAERHFNATMNAIDLGVKAIDDSQSVGDSVQGLWTSTQRSVLSSGRLPWYAALREVQEHIRNGRLADFSCLLFVTPCRRDIEFQRGVCLLLGEIAIDRCWEDTVRQNAVDFLAEIYRGGFFCGQNEGINSWILDILRKVSLFLDPTIFDHTQRILLGLEKEGNAAKQTLYRDVMARPPNPYPLMVRLPLPSSSPLLTRVQAILDVEYDLHSLKIERLQERENVLYIPLQAKPTLHSPNDTLFPLMESALEFLGSHRQVVLLLGDSGSGKSTFSLELERTLWNDYGAHGPIPLHINLPTIVDPSRDLIEKQLQRHRFSDAQIQQLRQSRQFIVICDGYDESQLKTNLYTTNRLNQPREWKAKLIISCRNQSLGSDYRHQFRPQSTNHYHRTKSDLLQEAVIAPFSRSQIAQYVEQYVSLLPASCMVQFDQPSWTKGDYLDKLVRIPSLMELVSNPFLLSLSLEALPHVVDFKKSLMRVELYDGFVTQWLAVSRARLENSALNDTERSEFDLLVDDDFVGHSLRFQKSLAEAIFREQAGHPVVQYTHLHDRDTWKAKFFRPDDHTKLLWKSSILTRSGSDYRFIHRSLLEYFYSRTIYDPLDYTDGTMMDVSRRPIHTLQSALGQRSIIGEPSIVQFLAERVEQDPSFRYQLLDVVEQSKIDMRVHAGQAATNAITILVKAGIRFNSADLSGIKIAGAHLRGGEIDATNLEGADLSETNLGKAWFRQANLRKVVLSGARFGELPYLKLEAEVYRCVFSSDGKLFAVSFKGFRISIYDATTWTYLASHRGGQAIAISTTNHELAKSCPNGTVELGDILTGDIRIALTGHTGPISDIVYSSNGVMIATASFDKTVRIWSTLTGVILHILSGHSLVVTGIAFSPTCPRLASSSTDTTVRIWDIPAGRQIIVLNGRSGAVISVTYSPNGRLVGSCSEDGSIMLWDAHTGGFSSCLLGHISPVTCVTFSPDGSQIASCGLDGRVRLWDPLNKLLLSTLSGHQSAIGTVVYSPTGDYIASGGKDGTVRIWKVDEALSDAFTSSRTEGYVCLDVSPDGKQVGIGKRDGVVELFETLTGTSDSLLVLTGHTESVNEVTFSPCSKWIASASSDSTVRLWCARTGSLLCVLAGHTGHVWAVSFSPNSHRVASASWDGTIRIWDTHSGILELVLMGHSFAVNDVAYSPSGNLIASGGNDMTVRLWCSHSGAHLLTLNHFSQVHRVVFTPDEQEVISLL
ncbi:hypothetical protein K457DRAFT_407861 [Linnemannia elongata AG-77]|uniref:Uncharacterized protein n=1 Tax=Linnemannia elongata AG-77 TaxID=1314771 RepID=A0A197K3F6_9FUNG|nr:hypothetical protein K457DRAFT_407861 [Linnemannia elongata AG-77]